MIEKIYEFIFWKKKKEKKSYPKHKSQITVHLKNIFWKYFLRNKSVWGIDEIFFYCFYVKYLLFLSYSSGRNGLIIYEKLVKTPL